MIETFQHLSFKPVQTAAPKRLRLDQIADYNRLGFVRAFDIFAEAEMREIRAYLNRIMADMGEAGGYGINCYQARLSGLYDIATDPRILDFVEDLMGPDILCWASAVLSKRPHDPKAVPWHQDAAFWRLAPARTVTVWLAIDDADDENSAMRFVPGTHDKGALAFKQSKSAENVFHIETADVGAMGAPVTNVLQAGQISLHADMLVHGSEPNRSNRRRCGLTLRYCPPSVEITDAAWAKGVEAILCRGSAGSWPVHPRPDNNDITMTSSPHVVGNN